MDPAKLYGSSRIDQAGFVAIVNDAWTARNALFSRLDCERWVDGVEENDNARVPEGEMKLENKVGVITGGNSGIGLATAQEFQTNGAKVVIFGRDRRSLDLAANRLGGEVLAIQGDVRRLGDIQHLFAQASQRFGKIDILVANAGIAKFAPVESMSEELFDELSDILFKGVFFTVQKSLPYLRDGASVILVGSSDADKQGRLLTSVYTASKSAVRALARAMSAELLPRRIRVNVMSPGMTDTPIITREGGMPGATPEQIAETITKMIPMRRRGTPEEMAKAMLFLASDDSSYCVGSELMADGGLTQLVIPA
jgi:NAD(P)-dependent dehydrogenase (short-subunit alcohol dehydrogenase family)